MKKNPKSKTIKTRIDDDTLKQLDELVILMDTGNRSNTIRSIIKSTNRLVKFTIKG
jgi:metal-responsive CopG/Arc/MetJ family transcriptional regulator